MPAEPIPPAASPAPAPPQIVVPPEVVEAIRAAGYASLVLSDGHPLMRVQPEPEAVRYERARSTMSPEEERALFDRYEDYDGPTCSLEELLASLPNRQTAEAA